MGYEITYFFHPRKEDGSYNTELKEEKTVKVGKPFDDTALEKCAAAIMLQLARRDIWVLDVKVHELVKKEINFKESTDGKGIILKNRKFSLSSTAEVLAEDLIEEKVQTLPTGVQPHELITSPAANTDISALYNGGSVPVKRTPRPPIDQNKHMYFVYFEPYMHQAEARALKLKFTEDRKYPVHAVIPSATGKLDAQKIAVSDDEGKVMILDEKYFTSAGRGLLADEQLGFSGSNGRKENKRKLMYDQELTIGPHPAEKNIQQSYKKVKQSVQADTSGIPLDDGSIPEEMLNVPDLRPGKKF